MALNCFYLDPQKDINSTSNLGYQHTLIKNETNVSKYIPLLKYVLIFPILFYYIYFIIYILLYIFFQMLSYCSNICFPTLKRIFCSLIDGRLGHVTSSAQCSVRSDNVTSKQLPQDWNIPDRSYSINLDSGIRVHGET